MKVKVKASEIMRSLKAVIKAVEAKDQILSNVKIIADNESLRMLAINSQYSIDIACPAVIDDAGEAIVDANTIYKVFTKASGECVLTSDEKSLIIKANGKTRLPIIDHDLTLPSETKGKTVIFDSVEFKNAINKIDYSISENQSRIILTGAHIVSDGNSTVFTSLDGFRLSQTEIGCSGDNIDLVIPRKILLALCDVIVTGELKLVTNGSRITFYGDDFTVNAATIAGNYIDTARIIPTEFSKKVLLKTADFKDCLDAATVASGSSNLVRLNISNDTVEILSNAQDVDFYGSVSALLNGDNVQTAFNLKYLIQAMNHINTEQCQLLLNTAVSPMVVVPYNDNVKPDINLLLPVRVFNNQ